MSHVIGCLELSWFIFLDESLYTHVLNQRHQFGFLLYVHELMLAQYKAHQQDPTIISRSLNQAKQKANVIRTRGNEILNH